MSKRLKSFWNFFPRLFGIDVNNDAVLPDTAQTSASVADTVTEEETAAVIAAVYAYLAASPQSTIHAPFRVKSIRRR